MKKFQETQLAFSQHLRAPELYPAPTDIEDRRVAIYRELIYNNIEGFISNAFPVLHSLLTRDRWHTLMRNFIARHSSQTPYFLEISQEFLYYLMHENIAGENDPVFMLELAHYEWIELALDVSTAVIVPPVEFPTDPLAKIACVSPLVYCLEYRYPVHKIAPEFIPDREEITYLIAYRNRNDQVKFMVTNPLTSRLIVLLQTSRQSLYAVFEQIAVELKNPNTKQLQTDGLGILHELFKLSIISHFE